MKRYMVLFILIIFFLLLSQPYYCDLPSDKSRVKYQVDGYYPPYEYLKDDELLGFDIELGRLIFNGSTYDVQYSSDVWANVIKRIKNTDIDICGLMTVSEARKKDVMFSNTVIQTHRGVFGKKDLNIKSIDDLRDYNIGILKADYAETILVDSLNIKSYFTFNSIEDAIVALDSGAIQLVFANQHVVDYYLVKHQLNGKIVAHLCDLYPANMAYGISKSRPDLVSFINNRLYDLQQSGTFEKIYQKHFHKHSNYYEQKQKNRSIILFIISLVTITLIIITAQIIIQRLRKTIKAATQELEEEHEWLSVTLRSIGDAVIATDSKGKIVFMNPTAQSLTGYTEAEAIEKPINEILKIENYSTGCETNIPVHTVINEKKVVELEADSCLITKHGMKVPISDSAAPINNNDGEFVGVVMVFRDMTEKVEAEKTLYHQAYYDCLTDLPNRKSFMEMLDSALIGTKEDNGRVAVLFIDLDNFKSVNDTLGHDAGDLLLQIVAKKLSYSIKDIGFIARMGGDEFAVLIQNAIYGDKICLVAENILNEFKTPFYIENCSFSITPSIGIAFYPDNGSNAKDILKAADRAMYMTKANGRNNYTIMKPE